MLSLLMISADVREMSATVWTDISEDAPHAGLIRSAKTVQTSAHAGDVKSQALLVVNIDNKRQLSSTHELVVKGLLTSLS